MTKEIRLSQGFVALVDDEDYERLNQFKWFAHKSYNTYYAQRHTGPRSNRHLVHMHREVLPTPTGFTPDHINWNGLDNRKDNLRPATGSQQQWNTRKQLSKNSKYKGVTKAHKSKIHPWVAVLVSKRKHYYLGCFATEEDAARAYDRAAREEFGEFAVLNFPPDGVYRP